MMLQALTSTVHKFSSLSSSPDEKMIMNEKGQSIVSGEIIIPKRCFHSRPRIMISLQDNFHHRVHRNVEDDITIASCCLQPAYVCAGDRLKFDLPYSLLPKNLMSLYYPTWYTLHIQVEDSEGDLICLDHQVTFATDSEGQPLLRERIQIPLINALTFPVPMAEEEDYDDDDYNGDEVLEYREESEELLSMVSATTTRKDPSDRDSHYYRPIKEAKESDCSPLHCRTLMHRRTSKVEAE